MNNNTTETERMIDSAFSVRQSFGCEVDNEIEEHKKEVQSKLEEYDYLYTNIN